MNQTTEATTAEYTKRFHELTQGETTCCLAAHAQPLGLSWKNKEHMETLKRLFDLGNPLITFAKNGSYCRISDEESKKVMLVILREYL